MEYLSLLLFIFLMPVVTSGEPAADPRLKRCPPTVQRSSFLKAAKDWDTCYEFRLQRRTWRSAHVSCLEQKGRLVTIREKRIQRFLVDTMYGMRFGPRRVWLGATDRAKEMEWVWVTGEKVDSGFTSWAPGQPSCGITCVEDCAVMNWREGGGRWHDYHCYWFDSLPYICEYDMIPEPKPKSTSTTTATTTTSTTTTTSPTTTTLGTSHAALGPTKPLETDYLIHGGRAEDQNENTTSALAPSLVLLGSNSAHVGQAKENTQKSSFGTESIVFLIVGLLLGLSAGFCLLFFILFRRRRKEKREEDPSVSYTNPYYGEITAKVKVVSSEDKSPDRGHLLQGEQAEDCVTDRNEDVRTAAISLRGSKGDKTWKKEKIKEFTEEEELMLGAEGGRTKSPRRKPPKVPSPPSPLHQRPKYAMNTYDSPPCLAAASRSSERKEKPTKDISNKANENASRPLPAPQPEREETSLSRCMDGSDYSDSLVASGENHYSEIGASNFSPRRPLPPSSHPPIPPLPVSYDVPRSARKRSSSNQLHHRPTNDAAGITWASSNVSSKHDGLASDSTDQGLMQSPEKVNSDGKAYANLDMEENLYESVENLRAAIENERLGSEAMLGAEVAYYGNVDFDGDSNREVPESLGDIYVTHSRPQEREEEERYVPFPGDDTYKAMR